MALDGPQAHFITHVSATIGDVTVTSDATLLNARGGASVVAALNAQLAAAGAAASVTLLDARHNGIVPLAAQLVLDLCPGQRVTITAVKPSTRQIEQLALHATSVYFNVDVDVVGCHDEFDGVVGQLYQCQYNARPFRWDVALEEHFRVASLQAPPHKTRRCDVEMDMHAVCQRRMTCSSFCRVVSSFLLVWGSCVSGLDARAAMCPELRSTTDVALAPASFK